MFATLVSCCPIGLHKARLSFFIIIQSFACYRLSRLEIEVCHGSKDQFLLRLHKCHSDLFRFEKSAGINRFEEGCALSLPKLTFIELTLEEANESD
jgi:hypothetical protein